MDKKKVVFTKDDLNVLNTLAQPVWLYSCATQKLMWGNKAALKYFNRTLETFVTYKFSRLASEDHTKFHLLNTLVRDEVENGGAEQTVSGFGRTVLPGVIPHEGLSSSEFLYRQIVISMPKSDTTLCTQVQLIRGEGISLPPPRTIPVKAMPKDKAAAARSSLDGRANGQKGASSIHTLIELCESILHGEEVDIDSVEALHQSILRGDVVTQPTRIEEELVSKEELDQDVGLNLLQLLGGKKLGEKYHAVPADSCGTDSDSVNAATSTSRSNIVRSITEGADDAFSIDEDQSREVVAASLMPAMEAVLGTVDDWRFDAFKLAEVTQGHPLSALGFWLMKRYDIISNFQLDATKLARFLRKIEDGYPDNPYHNKTHAADVMQGMHCLLTRGGLHRRLGEDVAMFASYMAAITHDYEHKGLNNDFLVRVGDELAFTYNDMSPMENHHVAAAFKLMRQKEYNFLKKLPREKWVRLRRLLIDMVLATDMKQHFNILSKFQAKLQVKLRSTNFSPSLMHLETPTHDEPLPIADDDMDKSLVLQVCLKCADVGHLAAPWDVHHRWVSGLEEEFFRQGDKEKSMHMMVSPLMDRCKDGITKSQVGFFDIVALPLFYSWASVFHEALPLVRAVEDNCNRWRALEMGRSAGSK